MSVNEAKTAILNNKTALGIEFGSTRIKAVLVDEKYNPIASGSYEWENRYENGVGTYSLDDIHKGLQGSYSDLVKDVQEKYGVELTSVGALGISHFDYLAGAPKFLEIKSFGVFLRLKRDSGKWA